VALIGVNFTPGSSVAFTYDDKPLATGTADTDGFVTITFKVPASKHGDHTILASDGVNSDTITFTVESKAPITPQPRTPGMGAAVDSPIKFTWDAVTDESAPITYNLQIATNDTFAADTILITKTGLATTEYTLSDVEERMLSTPGTTYYWREKALDGALNESAWTGAGQFTVSQPFKFSGWPLYLTMGIGALLFFLLGLWIGRRTAFYY
jgi:hypothetical protein